MTTLVASAELIVVSPSGEETSVTAGIGQPYLGSRGEWRCPLHLDGLHKRLPDAAGVDSLQALCLALSMLRGLLQDAMEDGGRILDPSDRSEFALDATFGRVGQS